jgi:hypothetical protein
LHSLKESSCRVEGFVKKCFNELKDSILFNFKHPFCDYFLIATEEKIFFARHFQRDVEIAKRVCEKSTPFSRSVLAIRRQQCGEPLEERSLRYDKIHLASDGAPYYCTRSKTHEKS